MIIKEGKVLRKIVLFAACLIGFSAFGSPNSLRPMGSGFGAPTVNGWENVTNPILGDIVYDSSRSAFFGYGEVSSTPTWLQFSGTSATPVAPTMQVFTSGSGTYTTPAGVLYIEVEMIGGGGGGAGSSTVAANNGGSGGNGGTTTFGTSLLSAGGGSGAPFGTGYGTGGAASITSPAIGNTTGGGSGTGAGNSPTLVGMPGGMGGVSFFGGAGGGSNSGASAGGAAVSNSGSGGGGAGAMTSSYAGGGGGAGAYVKAIISSPSATYSYSVGAAGSSGSAGTSGATGGAGAAGKIIVTEYYQ
jgi:hypothetical protein